jgi:hypothetical protein
MDKKTALAETSFGRRVAEEEGETLNAYFVETEQWRKVIAGDVDVVYGPKGSGKSAIYSLLVRHGEKLRVGRRTVMISAENPRGTPAFQGLVSDPPTSEEEFRGLWKLYFLTLLAQYIRRHRDLSISINSDATEVIDVLVENRLLEREDNFNLVRMLKSVLDYIRRSMPKALEGSLTEPSSGITATGKIILNEPNIEQREAGLISADELFTKLNSALTAYNITVWLLVDRLDVAFDESSQLENNALRSLFRVYLDLITYSKISVKIFLRDDIWQRLSTGGFREASHITKSLIISWDQQSLLNLIVQRLVYNPAICNFYSITKESILKDSTLQNDFFYRVFPSQIEIGQRQPKTLDWMLSRITDGGRKPAPRELIHLLSASRDRQLRFYELGNSFPPLENLFDKAAIKDALPEISKVRFEQTLCAEYPSLKPYLEMLEGEKTQQSITSLAKLWKCSGEEAQELAERLTGVGFFERKGAKDNPIYWVPFLYRDALNLVQGAA